MYFKLFLQTISVKLYSINLRLNAYDFNRSTDFADLYIIILNCKIIIYNILKESYLAEQKCIIKIHLDNY